MRLDLKNLPSDIDLLHRLVRVRGWVKRFNGPLIEVTHPEQIEVIEE